MIPLNFDQIYYKANKGIINKNTKMMFLGIQSRMVKNEKVKQNTAHLDVTLNVKYLKSSAKWS